ncbi:MAG: hypothetical protein ACK5TK_04745 [Betaproteobacteria bacterium]
MKYSKETLTSAVPLLLCTLVFLPVFFLGRGNSNFIAQEKKSELLVVVRDVAKMFHVYVSEENCLFVKKTRSNLLCNVSASSTNGEVRAILALHGWTFVEQVKLRTSTVDYFSDGAYLVEVASSPDGSSVVAIGAMRRVTR